MVGAVTAVLIGIDQEIGYRFYRLNITRGVPSGTDSNGWYQRHNIRVSDILLYGPLSTNGIPNAGYPSRVLHPLNTAPYEVEPLRWAPNVFDGNPGTSDDIVVHNERIGTSFNYNQRIGSFNFQFVRPCILTGYGIRPTDPQRGPGSWQFQGSKDGENWVTLHSQSNVDSWEYDANNMPHGKEKYYPL